MPLSRARSSNRNLRSHVPTTIKSEASMYGSDDDEDGEGEDDDDFLGMMKSQGFQGGPQASGSGSTGGRRMDSATAPTRTSKSRVKGESSQKRKEQNRIAQRAFRKRQKAYFIDLEKEVIEKTGKIQAITKSNQSLMEMMERLQRENIALKAAKAPNFAGVPFSSANMVSNEKSAQFLSSVGCSSTGDGHVQESGMPLAMDTEEDVLVSVHDLAGPARVPSRAGSSSSSSSTTTAKIVSPVATAPATKKTNGKPVTRKTKKKVSENPPRRNLSSRSGGSISQTSSVLAASTSPRQMPSDMIDTVPEPRRRRATVDNGVRVTEVINNPTWGMNEYLPPTMPKTAMPMGYSNGGGDLAMDPFETSPTSSVSAYKFASDMVGFAQMQQQRQQQQQQQPYYRPSSPQPDSRHWEIQQGQSAKQMQNQHERDQAEKARSARRYSEALQRYHAGPLLGHLNGNGPAPPSDLERPRTAESAPGEIRGVFAFNDMGLLQGGTFNGWQWNGQGYLDGQRIPASKDVANVEMPAQMDKQAFQVQVRQPMTAQHFQSGNDLPVPQSLLPLTARPADAPRSASPRPKTFAEMIPGLKHESNGTIMPFTGVLTPFDGFGSYENPFGPMAPGAHAGQPNLWRDIHDLTASTFGLEDTNTSNNNSSEVFPDSPMGTSFNL